MINQFAGAVGSLCPICHRPFGDNTDHVQCDNKVKIREMEERAMVPVSRLEILMILADLGSNSLNFANTSRKMADLWKIELSIASKFTKTSNDQS